MATPKTQNFSEALYRKLQARARRQHRSVAQEVTHILQQALESPRDLAITDLRGLGKDQLGAGVDATEHLNAERESWD